MPDGLDLPTIAALPPTANCTRGEESTVAQGEFAAWRTRNSASSAETAVMAGDSGRSPGSAASIAAPRQRSNRTMRAPASTSRVSPDMLWGCCLEIWAQSGSAYGPQIDFQGGASNDAFGAVAQPVMKNAAASRAENRSI